MQDESTEITLISQEGDKFVVSEKVAKMSATVKNLLEDIESSADGNLGKGSFQDGAPP
jgi:hypothetical protein